MNLVAYCLEKLGLINEKTVFVILKSGKLY